MGDMSDIIIDNYLGDVEEQLEVEPIYITVRTDNGVERETDKSYGCKVNGKIFWFSKKYCKYSLNENIDVPMWLLRKMGISFMVNKKRLKDKRLHEIQKEQEREIRYLRRQLINTMTDDLVTHHAMVFGGAITSDVIEGIDDED